ncbi:DUF2087 domain-containing protein [Streptomyces sp. NPDC059080]|uniref:DUF2087 domain-containing protein n=1 Tax=Streptomyces sp. NPDC059080 TaxID=3346718 RepID=UPI0036A44DA0
MRTGRDAGYATLFATDRSSSEREVDEALSTVHDGCSALRRHPVTGGLRSRTRDGSYRCATG